MRSFAVFLMMMALSSVCSAITVRPSLGASGLGSYTVADQEVTYEISGSLLKLDFMSSSGIEGGGYTGWGLDFAATSGKLESGSTASRLSPAEINLNYVNAKYILGYQFGSWFIELPLQPLAVAIEADGLNEGDQKYGMGVGLDIGYVFYSSLFVNLGYNYLHYLYGKNSSTGKTGSLANTVNFGYLHFTLGFSFSAGDGLGSGGVD